MIETISLMPFILVLTSILITWSGGTLVLNYVHKVRYSLIVNKKRKIALRIENFCPTVNLHLCSLFLLIFPAFQRLASLENVEFRTMFIYINSIVLSFVIFAFVPVGFLMVKAKCPKPNIKNFGPQKSKLKTLLMLAISVKTWKFFVKIGVINIISGTCASVSLFLFLYYIGL